MKARSPSPRTTEEDTVDLKLMLRQTIQQADKIMLAANRARAREDAAEERLHLVHDLLHRRRSDFYRGRHFTSAQLLEELAMILGYEHGDPDRHDCETWINYDAPIPVRQSLEQVRALQNGAREAE